MLATPAAAEMDAADYQVEQVIRSQARRDRIRSEIEREVDQEAELARRAALEQEQQGAEAAAAEARRPYPERLLHPNDDPARHGRAPLFPPRLATPPIRPSSR